MQPVGRNGGTMSESTDKAEVSEKKKPYTSPSLLVYGTVSETTKGSGGKGEDGGVNHVKQSDPSLKEGVVRVGTHPLGFGLYLFSFKAEFRDAYGHDRQFGVMADEVNRVVPEAVALDADGYLRVDYARLGISRN